MTEEVDAGLIAEQIEEHPEQIDQPDPSRHIGRPLKRKEDRRLITGRTRWTDNIQLPGLMHLAIVRSPIAHARINRVDVSGALERPGVIAAFSAADLGEALGVLPCAWPVTADMVHPDHHPLATDEVRHVGEAVAVVVATDNYAAADALEAVEVDYEPLPAVIDMEVALEDERARPRGQGHQQDVPVAVRRRRLRRGQGAGGGRGRHRVQAPLHPAAAGAGGDGATVGRRRAAHRGRRVHGLLGHPDPAHPAADAGADLPASPSSSCGSWPRTSAAASAPSSTCTPRRSSRWWWPASSGRPVKWTESRSEGFQATIHGRDQIQDIEVAATRDGKILGLSVDLIADMGAYLQLVTPGIPVLGAFMYNGDLQDGRVPVPLHRRVHHEDADRRLPRRRPPRGDVRDRTDHGPTWPTSSASSRWSCAGATGSRTRSSRTRRSRG